MRLMLHYLGSIMNCQGWCISHNAQDGEDLLILVKM